MNTTNPHADATHCMELLQRTPLTLHYLAEGNANVIYSVAPTTTTDPELSIHDHCCILRMRKDLPTTKPSIENLTAIHERITPLFTDEHEHALMPKALYRLDNDILRQASEILAQLHRKENVQDTNESVARRKHAVHPSLTAEPHAILMPNLRYGDGSHTLFREFKPKWLAQSPNAPADARRCRTCAANAFKRLQGSKKGKGDSGICPLNLLSQDRSIITAIVRQIGPEHDHAHSAELVDAFVERVQPVLHHLADLQSQHDTRGIDDARNPEGRDYAVAMALRDCSVFLVFQRTNTGGLELSDVKLADLDLKISSDENLQKWARMENDLIESGAYSGVELPGSTRCALEHI